MLPDYPKTKALLSKAFSRLIVRLQNEKLGIFGSVKATTLHEGSKTHTYRSDGTRHEMELKHLEASAQLQHDIRKLETLEVADIFKVADTLADGMARAKHDLFIERLNEACEESGIDLSEFLRSYPLHYLAMLLVMPHRGTSSGIRWLASRIDEMAADKTWLEA